MKKVTIALTGVSPYTQSRYHGTEKLNKESSDDYESRTWKEKAHFLDSGEMFIPQLAIKNALSEIAKYLTIQIPGKGKSTYTKHFEAGILVEDNAVIRDSTGQLITRDSILLDRMHVPSDGRRGGGSRVFKNYPTVARGWSASFDLVILDDVITQDVFSTHLIQAGMLIGIGSFRVRNNGTRGRFTSEIKSFENFEL